MEERQVFLVLTSEGGSIRSSLRGPGSGKAGLGGTVTWFPLFLGATGPARAESSMLDAIGLMETDFRQDRLRAQGKR